MNHAEYSAAMGKRSHAISRKRSLEMTVRMNRVWDIAVKGGKKQIARAQTIAQAEEELAKIVIPPKPEQPIGYEVMVDGDWQGFFHSDDLDRIKQECEELQIAGELPAGELTYHAKPRHADRDDFRYT